MKRLLLLLLLLPTVFAADYYADVNIDVSNTGLVSISGLTNHLNLSGEQQLVEENGYYLLNISLEEEFSNYVYEILLPEGSTINYLNTPNIMSLGEENGRIKITGIGSDEVFKAVVQYSVSNNIDSSLILFLLSFIPTIIMGFFLFRKKEYKKIDYSLLTRRQKKIMKIIAKEKKVSQNYLERNLKMPKSSLSRNIDSLIKKDLIKKEKKGVTNLLILK